MAKPKPKSEEGGKRFEEVLGSTVEEQRKPSGDERESAKTRRDGSAEKDVRSEKNSASADDRKIDKKQIRKKDRSEKRAETEEDASASAQVELGAGLRLADAADESLKTGGDVASDAEEGVLGGLRVLSDPKMSEAVRRPVKQERSLKAPKSPETQPAGAEGVFRTDGAENAESGTDKLKERIVRKLSADAVSKTDSKAASENTKNRLNTTPDIIPFSPGADKAAELKAAAADPLSKKIRLVDHRQRSRSAKNPSQAESKLNAAAGIEKAAGAPVVKAEDGLKPIELGASVENGNDGPKASSPKSFQSAVMSQLREGVNEQIVKQAGIVVKGDGTGEIKLIMKPEQLGKVRIQLSLNDNHIAGRIIVENNIVREIFESNLENLYKAFGSEGFENGGLQVSVQGGNADGSGRRSQSGSGRRAVQAMEDAVPEVAEPDWHDTAVNMVV